LHCRLSAEFLQPHQKLDDVETQQDLANLELQNCGSASARLRFPAFDASLWQGFEMVIIVGLPSSIEAQQISSH
jgi:hypothetical protein